MSLSSAHLDAFFTCAQVGNFTQAAQRLHITQSALSQRIKNLEEDLGTTLIIRDRSGLKLTEQGEELLKYCRNKNQIEDELISRIRGNSGKTEFEGTLRIGGFSSVMRSVILPALTSFLKQNPGVQLKMMTRELRELPTLLRSGEIDFLITDHEITNESLNSLFLGEEENVLIQKKNHSGRELFLDHDENDQTTLKYFGKKSFNGMERNYLDDIYGIIDGVRGGLGKAVVPKHLIKPYKDIQILNPKKILGVKVFLHYYKQPYYTELCKKVVTELKTGCASMFSEAHS